jgi:hypothetical protein
MTKNNTPKTPKKILKKFKKFKKLFESSQKRGD